MNNTLLDRLVSILSYYTFGIFSIIWIIFANLTKKRISQFLAFNLYQAIFLSICLAIISLIYSIAINFISVIPFIGNIAKSFDLFFNQTPLYFTFSVSGLLITILTTYLAIMSLLGKKPYFPIISETVTSNFGG